MKPIWPPYFLAVGLLMILSGAGLYLQRYMPQKPRARHGMAALVPKATVAVPVSILAIEAAGMPTPLPTVWIEPTPNQHAAWTYDGVDLASSQVTFVTVGGIALNPVTPYPWTPDSLGSGIFDWGHRTGLAWADDHGRVGFWIHSGEDETAYPLQLVLERTPQGYLVSADEGEARLAALIGAPVTIDQAGWAENSIVVAAVRVPPLEVPSLDGHVEDLAEYLAEHYPGQGWEQIVARDDALMLFFCGLRLAGEEKNPRENFYRQARFIIGLLPERGGQG